MTLIKDSKIDFSQPDIYTGILKPNSYTDVELAAIVNPQEGWLAENSDDNSLQRYNGTAWVDIGGGTPAYGGYEALVGPNQTYKSVNEALGDNKYIIAVVEDVTENDVVLAQAGTLFIRIDLFATWTCNQGMDFQSLSVVEELEINGSAKGRLVINMTGGQNGDCIEMTAGKYVFFITYIYKIVEQL